jgi:hypothetical protein
MSTDQAIIQPNTPQWCAWREHLSAVGGREELLARMDKAVAAGKAMRVPKEWPTEESRRRAETATGEVCRASTPLSDGARWLGLYGSVEESLIDAHSPLVKAGLRPSDRLIAITTREAELPFRETRWPADDFLRKAPPLRVGQHVTVEWARDTEIKLAVAITWGLLLGNPEALREEDVIPFLKAHPLTRKRLLTWWMERHPEAGEEIAEAALRNMNPRELQNATLLADNEDACPAGGRHQVHYQPDAELWRVR